VGRLVIPRTLVTGAVVSAATTYRVGVNWLGLLVDRAPSLAGLALEGAVGRAGSGRAQAAFRDELIGLARESAEASWRELRRGVDDLDELTRPAEEPRGGEPRRPHRVKP
jgi:hypothetical protein